MSAHEQLRAESRRPKENSPEVGIGGEESLFELTACRGRKANCPNVLIDVEGLCSVLREKLTEMDQAGYLGERTDGPVLSHHKFKVAVAGCPNACSQPQIKDVGIIGLVAPRRGEGSCTKCGACVRACLEKAIRLNQHGPVVDVGACLACGACVRACEQQSLVGSKPALRAIVAGRLGRHPALASDLGLAEDPATVAKALDVCIRGYHQNRKPRERFGSFVDRFGLRKLQNLCIAAGLKR